MSRRRSSRSSAVAGAAVLLALGGALAAALWWSQRLPEGPVPVVWDKEACAWCHMHVGDPHFAAQVQLDDGRVLNFDDPGCAMSWLEAKPAAPLHAVWFHHVGEDRWIAKDQVAFAPTSPSPMGYGLGAVEQGQPGALGFDAAMERVRQQNAGRQHGASSWR